MSQEERRQMDKTERLSELQAAEKDPKSRAYRVFR